MTAVVGVVSLAVVMDSYTRKIFGHHAGELHPPELEFPAGQAELGEVVLQLVGEQAGAPRVVDLLPPSTPWTSLIRLSRSAVYRLCQVEQRALIALDEACWRDHNRRLSKPDANSISQG